MRTVSHKDKRRSSSNTFVAAELSIGIEMALPAAISTVPINNSGVFLSAIR